MRGSAGYAGTLALDGFDLLRFVVPDALGNPLKGAAEFSSHRFFHEKAGYVGLAAPLLAVWSLTRADAKRWEYGAAACCTGLLVIALGRTTPVFESVGRFVPGLFAFRCPGRTLSIASLLIALLAGRGLDVWCSERRRPRVVAGQLC